MKIGQKWLRGYVECRVEGGSLERFLNMCRHHEIYIWKLRRAENVRFCMYARDFRRLVPLSAKASVYPHILKRKGLPFQIETGKRNWTFYTGFLLFLGALFVLSSYVWEITYSGQQSFSRETLSRDVEGMDVYPGMRRSRLDCDAIEKRLREIHPEISWVSAEEVGSVLEISIKEGKENVEHEKMGKPHHLTALCDGTVQEISVNRGTAAVKKGQKVRKGDILISGLVPVTDDSGTVTENMTVSAKGEVSILVEHAFSEKVATHYQKKIPTGKTVTQYSVQWQDKRIYIKNPFKQLDNADKYDIITTVCADRVIHPLPVAVRAEKKEFREYELVDSVYTKEELKAVGMRQYQRKMDQLTADGMELTAHSAVMRQQDANTWLLQGKITFLCGKMGTREITEAEGRVEAPKEREEE